MSHNGFNDSVAIAKMIASNLESDLSNEVPRVIHHDTRPIIAALEFAINNTPGLPESHSKILNGALKKTNELSESVRVAIQKHAQVPDRLLSEIQQDQSLSCVDETLNYLVVDAINRIKLSLASEFEFQIVFDEKVAKSDIFRIIDVNLFEIVNRFSEFVKLSRFTKYEITLSLLAEQKSAGIVLSPVELPGDSSQVSIPTSCTVQCSIQGKPKWLCNQVLLYADQFYNRLGVSEMIKSIIDRKLKGIDRIGKYDGESFSNINQFTEKIEDVKRNADYFVNFVDWDIDDKPASVLRLIAELGIQENTYIISKKYSHKDFQKAAEEAEFKVIPFQILESTSFTLSSEKVVEHRERRDAANPEIVKRWLAENPISDDPKRRLDCVLVDDSEIIRSLWKNWAEKNSLRLLAVSSPKEFYENERDITPNVPIYIDLHLGFDEEKNPISGRDFARTLNKFDFNNLHFCTGEDHVHDRPIYIRSVIGKNPPSFELFQVNQNNLANLERH